ncbi:MAG: periplasmic heavy metal sensor [Chitinophagaceae bacterium]|nr:periplasmic heavy metal sensor [Chitinophagaceae bacterium]
MNNPRILKILLLILLLLNLGTLSFIWMHKPPPHREEVGAFLKRKLHFSEEQEKLFDSMKQAHRRYRRPLMQAQRDARDKLFALLKNPQIDSATVIEAVNQIWMNKKEEELSTFYHFSEVRKICTPEQQKIFDEVIQEGLRNMAPPLPPKDGR